ncbi:MAG: hypothetical protein AB8F78_01590 [Saprospiraceae bacterium]
MGSRASKLGFYDVPEVTCQHCGVASTHRVTVFGKYFMMSIVPMFPTGHEMVAECENCNKTIPQEQFPPALIEHYQPNKSRVKRPIWHFLGVAAIGVFLLVGLCNKVTDSLDPRSELLSNDLAQMTRTPAESDTISTKISTMLMIATMGDDLNEEDFSYRTVVNGDNVMILVGIPAIDNYDEESRDMMVEVMASVADEQFDLLGKNMYYGLEGSNSLKVAQTPAAYEKGDMSARQALYEFYGSGE